MRFGAVISPTFGGQGGDEKCPRSEAWRLVSLNRSSRREEALAFLSELKMSLLTSAATGFTEWDVRFMGATRVSISGNSLRMFRLNRPVSARFWSASVLWRFCLPPRASLSPSSVRNVKAAEDCRTPRRFARAEASRCMVPMCFPVSFLSRPSLGRGASCCVSDCGFGFRIFTR